MYKISEVAKISKITVRALHYYDEIGLLTPSVDDKGYRLYSENDFLRLQQIMFFRELDFSLKDIKLIMDSPNFNREEALIKHRELLNKKKERIEEIISTLNKSLDEIKGETIMKKEDMFKGFSTKEIESHKKKYAKETKEKYGESSEYKESELKTSNYDDKKWSEIINDMNEIYFEISKHIGEDPKNEDVQNLIGRWREHITKNYYNCSVEVFEGLGEMYISDSRFTKNIDKYGEGLAEFLSQGIKFYCENQKK